MAHSMCSCAPIAVLVHDTSQPWHVVGDVDDDVDHDVAIDPVPILNSLPITKVLLKCTTNQEDWSIKSGKNCGRLGSAN